MTTVQLTIFGTATSGRRQITPEWNNEATNNWTLEQARTHVANHADDGVNCPCCGQRAQVYRRTLNAGMARALVLMWRQVRDAPEPTQEPIDIRTIDVRGGDYGKLAYWGLIKPSDDTAGIWRITHSGVLFVTSSISVPRAVYVYGGRVLNEIDFEMTTIRQALSEKFDLIELLNGGR